MAPKKAARRRVAEKRARRAKSTVARRRKTSWRPSSCGCLRRPGQTAAPPRISAGMGSVPSAVSGSAWSPRSLWTAPWPTKVDTLAVIGHSGPRGRGAA